VPYVFVVPEMVAAAGQDMAGIGSTINAANAAAAAATPEVLAAGADEVSTGIAALFGEHARAYQALSAQVAALHEQFVQALSPRAPRSAPAAAPAATARMGEPIMRVGVTLGRTLQVPPRPPRDLIAGNLGVTGAFVVH
jgi:hypothetical protein